MCSPRLRQTTHHPHQQGWVLLLLWPSSSLGGCTMCQQQQWRWFLEAAEGGRRGRPVRWPATPHLQGDPSLLEQGLGPLPLPPPPRAARPHAPPLRATGCCRRGGGAGHTPSGQLWQKQGVPCTPGKSWSHRSTKWTGQISPYPLREHLQMSFLPSVVSNAADENTRRLGIHIAARSTRSTRRNHFKIHSRWLVDRAKAPTMIVAAVGKPYALHALHTTASARSAWHGQCPP
uniref:Putative secreted protein n=1 Tax=Amblyomma triste TaxID=251400 RepID=A0A023G355_AMBTT